MHPSLFPHQRDIVAWALQRGKALIAAKVYKDGVPHDKAMQIIVSERGAHFDPDVVDAFVEVQEEFAAIAQRFADTDADLEIRVDPSHLHQLLWNLCENALKYGRATSPDRVGLKLKAERGE